MRRKPPQRGGLPRSSPSRMPLRKSGLNASAKFWPGPGVSSTKPAIGRAETSARATALGVRVSHKHAVNFRISPFRCHRSPHLILRLGRLNRLPLHIPRRIGPAALQGNHMVDHVALARARCLAGGRARVRFLELAFRSCATGDAPLGVARAGRAARRVWGGPWLRFFCARGTRR